MTRITSSLWLLHIFAFVLALATAAGAQPMTVSLLGVAADQPTTTAVVATPSAAPDPASQADPLTPEERTLQNERLLPANYGQLKFLARTRSEAAAGELYRTGLKGPFSPGYGEPKSLLDGARNVHQSPDFVKMYASFRRGDIAVVDYNNPNDYISKVTGGPFTHALICTEDGPPAGFIEAVGVTGSQSEPSANRVRRVLFHPGKNLSVRVLRPTEGMPAAAAATAIDRAVAFAQDQLGKPYNYSFTDTSKSHPTDAFYCSELCFLAYASPQGADLAFNLNKSPERDQVLLAVDALTTALQPRSKIDMMGSILKFMNSKPKPNSEQLVAFLVERVMTDCDLTKGVVPTGDDRAKLTAALDSVIQGHAFDRFQAAQDAMRKQEEKGDFRFPVLGFIRRDIAKAKVYKAWSEDLVGLVRSSGLEPGPTAEMTEVLVRALLPYSQVICGYLFGPKDGRTEGAGHLLDALDRVKRATGHLPLLGHSMDWLPARAALKIKSDFVSPTDLAWADVAHTDYNVRPDHPITPPSDPTAGPVSSTQVN